MPGWNDIVEELQVTGTQYDVVRRKYLKALARKTKRNVIVYYSGWLQKPQIANLLGNVVFAVSDGDKSSFMAVVHKMDRSKGLDLVLHTPGGDTAATESLVQYLHDMFGNDSRQHAELNAIQSSFIMLVKLSIPFEDPRCLNR